MNVLKCIVSAAVGGVCGAILWIVVSVPACIVLAIKHGNSRQAEAEVNSMPPIFIVAGALIGLFIAVVDERRKMANRDRRELVQEGIALANEKQRKEAELAEEERRRNEVNEIRNSTLNRFNRLPLYVSQASTVIGNAEKEFDEGAFAPFWDEIERATNLLAEYQHEIEGVNQALTKERRLSPTLRVPAPTFSLPMGKLPDAQPTVARLQAIVRKAQKNFHFSSIYEQRKTNKILIAGFGTLASAINDVGSRITSSIHQMSMELSVSLDNLLEATHEQAGAIRAQTSELSEQMYAESESKREYQEKQLEQSSVDTAAKRAYEKSVLGKQNEQIKLLDRIGKK